jgi:hypothetical protein
MRRTSNAVLFACGTGLLVSCASFQPTQVAPGGPVPQASTLQQSGQVNAAVDVAPDVSGWTGIEYSTALPLGQIVLILVVVWLSHRREVLRIKRSS